ncbi:RNA polymerase sigma factor SigC [Saccharothrix algeriensis]|uniref:RNA polymerase sigma factor n=1 Tax=Saccharothrix algeriensis TaxID=173560 RepID=A0A8T8HW05_9PSEU|nr:RNA polymerase sigma factor SigC [Saccharothrix algeriensis]MBM7814341.1 RNA polymerase sigma-70 factor (ECF subfamily) [Saccharothrix algeriensis]QTR02672.1 RNA polymerase sigma factor SigC [Saccharothrix algeriensis]
MSISRGDDDAVTTLALAAGSGDRAALERFIRATQRDVWRLVAHLTDPGRADDLAQEVYLRALRSLPSFEGRSSARTWLLSIARRTVVDHLRAAGSRPAIAWSADVQQASDARRSADRSAGFEDVVELNLLLADLAPERREALLLTQVLGLSYAEVAEMCGCPIGTVRSRVARAREDLLRGRGNEGANTG